MKAALNHTAYLPSVVLGRIFITLKLLMKLDIQIFREYFLRS